MVSPVRIRVPPLTKYLRVGYAPSKQRAATVLQPEQYRAELGRIRFRTRMPETAQLSGISQQDRA